MPAERMGACSDAAVMRRMQWLILRAQLWSPKHAKGKHAERQLDNHQCQTCTQTKPRRCAWHLPRRARGMPRKSTVPCLGRAW